MTCLRRKHHEAKRFGFYGRKRIQRYRCPGCNATFSEPRKRPLGRLYTGPDKAAQIATLLLEGMSVRAVSRITGAHQGTILSLLLTFGDNCRNLFDKRVRGIRPRFVQADELWTFVHTKERHIRPGSPAEWGDSHIWMAIDSETKMVLSYLVAKREAMAAYDFIRDLSERVTGGGVKQWLSLHIRSPPSAFPSACLGDCCGDIHILGNPFSLSYWPIN
jgi:transposase-like protein